MAVPLAELARRIGFFVCVSAERADHEKFIRVDRSFDSFILPTHEPLPNYAVIATQGSGDNAAFAAVLNTTIPYVAFVGSRKKPPRSYRN